MRTIDAEQIRARIAAENGWWKERDRVHEHYDSLYPRAYLDPFMKLVEEKTVRRAIVLMGPRRVGKTVLIHHAIKKLIDIHKIDPSHLVYFSVDHPLFSSMGLEQMLQAYSDESEIDYHKESVYAFFDEIQYLKDWEVHLKSLSDSYPNLKLVVSGSAGAALRLKSMESGAGRFTDFYLPPLMFSEYLHLCGDEDLVLFNENNRDYQTRDINRLNEQFLGYINFGGYPEALSSEEIQADPGRYIKADIIDKVLLRDLPSLYGIGDIQDLNRLFTMLAFNTSNEISIDELSRDSGIAKNTIKKYLEYLEAAFLIKQVHRLDRTAHRFQRAATFKVYLTNPSTRAALFAPINDQHDDIGSLVENAVFTQWFHWSGHLHYARWKTGEVDLVQLNPELKVEQAVEVKWSDRYPDHPQELKAIMSFCRANNLDQAFVTTKTILKDVVHQGLKLRFIPASLYCYGLGDILRGIFRFRHKHSLG